MRDDSRSTLTPVVQPRPAAKPAAASAARVITIDIVRVAANWRALAAHVHPAECSAVVKADAYGLGIATVVPALEDAGCRTYFVATIAEASAVRAVAPAGTIYVLDGLLPGQRGPLVEIGARPVLSSLAEVRDWAELGAGRLGPQPAALQLETGMNRLGLSRNEIDVFVAEPDLLARIDVRLVMSHLACADTPQARQNADQLAAFHRLCGRLPAHVVPDQSLAASRGILLGSDYRFDLVRPGYALFAGLREAGDVACAVTVEARVLSVRDVEAGDGVGYGAAWRAKRRSRIATVAIGYADGLPRSAGGVEGRPDGQPPAEVAYQGRRAPIIGPVSMDLITVDVTGLGENAPKRGDNVEIIGPTIRLEDAARASGTIGYELLTGLSRRAARVIRGPLDGQN